MQFYDILPHRRLKIPLQFLNFTVFKNMQETLSSAIPGKKVHCSIMHGL